MRSCYTTKMRFGNGLEKINVRWFFVPDKTKVYKGPHNFYSTNWNPFNPVVDTGAIGEVFGEERKWFRGTPPMGTIAYGPPDGPEEFFRAGASGTWEPLPLGWQGFPLNCIVEPPPPPPPITVPCCGDTEIAGSQWVKLYDFVVSGFPISEPIKIYLEFDETAGAFGEWKGTSEPWPSTPPHQWIFLYSFWCDPIDGWKQRIFTYYVSHPETDKVETLSVEWQDSNCSPFELFTALGFTQGTFDLDQIWFGSITTWKARVTTDEPA